MSENNEKIRVGDILRFFDLDSDESEDNYFIWDEYHLVTSLDISEDGEVVALTIILSGYEESFTEGYVDRSGILEYLILSEDGGVGEKDKANVERVS